MSFADLPVVPQAKQVSTHTGRRLLAVVLAMFSTALIVPVLAASVQRHIALPVQWPGAGLPLRAVFGGGGGGQAAAGDDGLCHRMLWFTAVSSGQANDYHDFVKAALLSARDAAPSLVPVLLYCSEEDAHLARWYEQHGGYSVLHRLSFMNLFDNVTNENWRKALHKAEGVYLRLDITRVVARILAEGQIPLANVSSTYALYTDADVMFTGQGSHADISTCTQPLPRLIRLGPQHARGTSENSGVLLLNISSWGAELPPFVEYGRLRDFRFGQYDQGWLIDYLRDHNKTEAPIPDRLNWKAYWGSDPNATIIHWHGPKPRRGNCLECFLKYGRRPGWEKHAECKKCEPIYVGMVNMANTTDGGAMYERMLQRFEGFMRQVGGHGQA